MQRHNSVVLEVERKKVNVAGYRGLVKRIPAARGVSKGGKGARAPGFKLWGVDFQKKKINKTGFINDPLSQTYSLASN